VAGHRYNKMDTCENPTQQSVLNRPSKDKFLLVLNLPQVLKKQSNTDSSIDIDPLQISVHGTIVPAITVPSNEVRFAGQSYNVSSYSRPNYPPLSINFIIDNKFKNYWLLWKWMSILNSPTESMYAGTASELETYKDRVNSGINTEYQSNFSIFSLNEYNQKTVEFTYYNAFITGLGAINYSYRDDGIIESTAEFQFSQLDIKLLG
jgi:hypothetical protein